MPEITDTEAKAAYNTLRDYCKITPCEKCSFSVNGNTTVTDCQFDYDITEGGITAPADWSGE